MTLTGAVLWDAARHMPEPRSALFVEALTPLVASMDESAMHERLWAMPSARSQH